MKEKRFFELLSGIENVRIAVLGDIFLDKIYYVERAWDEISVETGLIAYQVKRKKSMPGAAGVVTNILSDLRVKEIYGLGLLSEDGDGFELEKELRKTGVDTSYMIRTDKYFTPTYIKTFFEDKYTDYMEETHRLDIKNREHLPKILQDRIIANIRALEDKVDAFVCLEQIQDRECGIFSERVIGELARIGKEGKCHVLADSRYHIRDFCNVIKKCNDLEAISALGYCKEKGKEDQYFTQLNEAVLTLAIECEKPVIVTCGEAGMKVSENGAVKTIPAFPVKGKLDICGAGDSALAGVAAAVCAGASLTEAAFLGNLVASMIVQQIGVTGSINRKMLEKRFQEYIAMYDA